MNCQSNIRKSLTQYGQDKKHLEEAEGYLYSAIQAVKVAEEQFSVDNIKMIAHSD